QVGSERDRFVGCICQRTADFVVRAGKAQERHMKTVSRQMTNQASVMPADRMIVKETRDESDPQLAGGSTGGSRRQAMRRHEIERRAGLREHGSHATVAVAIIDSVIGQVKRADAR